MPYNSFVNKEVSRLFKSDISRMCLYSVYENTSVRSCRCADVSPLKIHLLLAAVCALHITSTIQADNYLFRTFRPRHYMKRNEMLLVSGALTNNRIKGIYSC